MCSFNKNHNCAVKKQNKQKTALNIHVTVKEILKLLT